MKNVNLLKRTFVRQSGQDECGNSCLAMILNYSGQRHASRQMRSLKAPPEGFSLLSLKKLAAASGLNGSCVELEIAFLRQLKNPCILHTLNDHGEQHYQVCYGSDTSRKGVRYLMADPAKQFYFIAEEELSRRWPSRAALYFEGLEVELTSFNASTWVSLLSTLPYPVGLWVVLPLMSILSAFMGIALSWLLQKGISNSSILESHVIAILLCLLLLIGMCRAGLSFLRQFILIKVNTAVNNHLTERFISATFYSRAGDFPASPHHIRSSIRDIQRIQNAISSFLSIVLPEGTLVIFLISVISWNTPLGGLLSLIYIITVGWLAYTYADITNYQITHLLQLVAANEDALIKDALNIKEVTDPDMVKKYFKNHCSRQTMAISDTSAFATSAGLRSLWIDTCSAVYVIGLFAFGMVTYGDGELSYSTLMIIVICGYFASTLMPRLCLAMNTLAAGADAFIQYQAFHTDRT